MLGGEEGGGWLDVTLGSLGGESLGVLEGVGVLLNGEDDDGKTEDGKGGPEGDEGMEGVEAPTLRSAKDSGMSYGRNRGMPYFEDMVEHSRLGRIRRQKGGSKSQDGRVTVHWEVVEIGGEEMPDSGDIPQEAGADGSRAKRQKLEV